MGEIIEAESGVFLQVLFSWIYVKATLVLDEPCWKVSRISLTRVGHKILALFAEKQTSKENFEGKLCDS